MAIVAVAPAVRARGDGPIPDPGFNFGPVYSEADELLAYGQVRTVTRVGAVQGLSRSGGVLAVSNRVELTGSSESLIYTCRVSGFGSGGCGASSSWAALDGNATIAGEPPPNMIVAAAGRHLSEVDEAWAALISTSPRIVFVPDIAPLGGDHAVVVAAIGTPIPGATGNHFGSFGGEVALGDDAVLFIGYGDLGLSGLYRWRPSNATLERIVDSTQSRPRGGGNYGAATAVDANGPLAAWSDAGGAYVVPLDGSAAPTQPAAPGDAYGPGQVLGANFSQLSIWGDQLLFRGVSQSGHDGIYAVGIDDQGNILRIVDDATPPPDGGSFGPLQNAVGGGHTVIVEAYDPAFQYRGLYAWLDGTLSPFVLRGDELLGKTVFVASSGEHSVTDSGAGVAFQVSFTDNTTALMMAWQLVLSDGFESGDLHVWSSTVP